MVAKKKETTKLAYAGSVFDIEFYMRETGEVLAEGLKEEFENRERKK